jgi:hypothetical protein
MDPQAIKEAITKIAAIHAQSGDTLDDIKETDFLEQEAFNFIIGYCHKMNYKADGFPSASTDYDELTDEHWMLFVDKLTLVHDDVAQLHWHWVTSFWPDEYESLEVFLDMVKARIGGSFYDVSLD